MKKCAILIFLILFTGCASAPMEPHEHGEFTKHYEESLFKVTENGMFSIEMIIKEEGLKAGINAVELIIHDKNDRDVIGADISVTPWMPEMGHGVFEKPVITEGGGGLYTVENIILVMGGHWELKVHVKADDIVDGAVFDFPDVQTDKEHKHGMVHAPAPSDLDLSATRLSDGGNFRVSYRSDIEPVPVNRIHGWTLTVETADGRPVTDIVIDIDGDMPEHGHGLPTQPEVTQDIGDGTYLVEGMKFSMPGWWVIKFYMKTQDKEEEVSFNLLVKE